MLLIPEHARMRTHFSANLTCCLILAIALSLVTACSRKSQPATIDAAAVFNKKCTTCHFENNGMRAPGPEALREMSTGVILNALESGPMRIESQSLSHAQKVAVANYLGKPMVAASSKVVGVCARDLDPPPNPPV